MNITDVNLFFACDDSYVPFLAVTLASIKQHRSKERCYNIKILTTGIKKENEERLLSSLADFNFNIEVADISDSVNTISEKLHTRDYYSKTTYYRLFIPELYKDIDKALYLDCDLVLCTDVAELYDTELKDNLVGAVADGFVSSVSRLHDYVTERVGVHKPCDYFNAGVLLMNLKEMRNASFGEKFIELIGKITFNVAQDQDYLNVLCNGRRAVISDEWNCMPGFCKKSKPAKLIHFNLDSKPWHKDGIEFSEVFWKYADMSCFAKEIREIHDSYSENEKSEGETRNLIDVAEEQGRDEEENRRIREQLASIWM